MAIREDERPVYNEKSQQILRYLDTGLSSQEVAKKLGYSNEKSMKTLMYRWNFRWDKEQQTYVPKQSQLKEIRTLDKIKPISKASIVIEMMGKQEIDIEAICKQAGFKDHRELAEYMTAKGYVWSPEMSNYIKKIGKIEENNKKNIVINPEQTVELNSIDPAITTSEFDSISKLLKYLPLLELLDKNKDRLLKQFTSTGLDGTIPRYIVPGRTSGKTIQMSDSLQDMAVEFCNEKNIKQRELFEVALIEFFKKYGYEYEIDSLLRSN